MKKQKVWSIFANKWKCCFLSVFFCLAAVDPIHESLSITCERTLLKKKGFCPSLDDSAVLVDLHRF